uniref:Uncharacterized protein n=1 Tax=Glossina palpalis gambiensis TaxID=67801 RepID=A0A1B0AU61_9MUSC
MDEYVDLINLKRNSFVWLYIFFVGVAVAAAVDIAVMKMVLFKLIKTCMEWCCDIVAKGLTSRDIFS